MFLTSRLRSLPTCKGHSTGVLPSSPLWAWLLDHPLSATLHDRAACTWLSKQRALTQAAPYKSHQRLSQHRGSVALYHSHRQINNGGHDLRRFLEIGCDIRESRFWLKQFKRMIDDGHPFAVLQVDENIPKNEAMLYQFASAMAFLHRNGMNCVIVYGLNVNDDRDRGDNSWEKRQELNENLIKLVSAMESQQTPVRVLYGGSTVLQTDTQDVTSITRVNRDLIDWCLSSSFVPVVTSQGETPTGKLTLLDPVYTCEEMAKVFTPLKVMFLNTEGGMKDKKGKVVPNINLPLDLHEDSPWPWGGQESWDRIRRIYDLLKVLPSQSSAVAMAADSVLTELFTHTGSGTFFKISEPVHSYSSFQQVDLHRLTNLISSSFDKTLIPDFFKNTSDKLCKLYLSENYTSAAIVTQERGMEFPYLDKFVVSRQAQGQGCSELIWSHIRADFPSLFWRSKRTNKINQWYFKKCDGSCNHGDWIVFWYGIGHDLGSQVINFAAALDVSFLETESGCNEEDREKLGE